jgi:F-type H+-transporting ATPase subunit epsilon
MRLVVVTPRAVVVDEEVRHVRAEDATGAFGILDGHADFLTALVVSVLVYRDARGEERFVAVRGGMLTVSDRSRVEVLAREAVASDDVATLERDVLARFRKGETAAQQARRGLVRLEGALVRRVADYIRRESIRGREWPRRSP